MAIILCYVHRLLLFFSLHLRDGLISWHPQCYWESRRLGNGCGKEWTAATAILRQTGDAFAEVVEGQKWAERGLHVTDACVCVCVYACVCVCVCVVSDMCAVTYDYVIQVALIDNYVSVNNPRCVGVHWKCTCAYLHSS